MFDLIGFWAAVTVLVSFTILPLVMWLYPLLVIILSSAIPNKEDSQRFQNFLFRKQGYHDIIYIFNKRTGILDVFYFLALPAGMWITLILLGVVLDGEPLGKMSLIEVYSLWAVKITPLFSWIGSAALVVLAFRAAVKYIYYAVKFKEKVEAHVSDKSIHK